MQEFKLREWHIFIPALAAYIILGLIYPFLGLDIIKFILFQVLFLLLPGYLFAKWFISMDLTKIQRIILGYPVSLVLIFLLSWTGKLLNINRLEAVMPVFSAISALEIFKTDKAPPSQEESRCVGAGILVYVICIISVFWSFIIPSAPPAPGYPGLYYQDSLSQIGVTRAYMRGFPLEWWGFSGAAFGYHMLQNVNQGVISSFTKIDTFDLHFYIEPVFDWMIMVFLIFFGALKIAKLSLRKTVIFLLGLFFLGPILKDGSFQNSLFMNPLSFYFGLPVFVLFIFCIYSYLNGRGQLDIAYLAVLYLFFTATKATLGIVVPAVLAIMFSFHLLKRRIVHKEWVLIFCFFVAAILLKSTVFQNTIHSISFDGGHLNSRAYELLCRCAFVKEYIGIIYPIYRFFSNFFRILPYYLLNWSVLLFLSMAVLDNNFRNRLKRIRESMLFIFVFCLFSMVIRCLFIFTGGDVYFLYYSQVVFLLLGALSFDYILEQRHKTGLLCAVLLSAFCFGTFIESAVDCRWNKPPWLKSRIWDERAGVDFGEWQAMRWLRQNSDKAAVFFSDRRYFTHETADIDVPRFYAYSAISARRAFAEGETSQQSLSESFKAAERWKKINDFLECLDPDRQAQILKSIPADYFVQSLRFNNREFSNLAALKAVYGNDSVKIFKILK